MFGLSLKILWFQNGDGFINRQELGYVMENLGEKMEKEEIECLINEIDIDGELYFCSFYENAM